MTIDATAWQMAKDFGWTLDYIDSLALNVFDEYRDFGDVMDGVNKARDFLRRRNSSHSNARRKR